MSCGLDGAVTSPKLGSPSNVRLSSYNMDLVLRWDPPEGGASGLVYTAEYRLHYHDSSPFRPGCENSTLLWCDFSRLDVPSEFGEYVGRVRAVRGHQVSPWARSQLLTLDKHTVIGPPNVSLHSDGLVMSVSLRDPVFAVSSLRSVFSSPTFNLTYWKDGDQEEARTISNSQENLVTLSDLEADTRYCVRAVIITRNPNPSEASRAVCERTGHRKGAPWVAAVVTFLALAAAALLLVLAVVYRARIAHFLCPKESLPQHLLILSGSIQNLVKWGARPADEIYHKALVVPQDAEQGCPLEAAGGSSREAHTCTEEEEEEEE